MTVFICIFSVLLVASSLMVLCSNSTVFSVLWLASSFLNASGIAIILGSEFIAMMLVIIYVGAVAVLFLFAVMMLEFKNYKNSFMSVVIRFGSMVMLSILMTAGLLFCTLTGNSPITQDLPIPLSTSLGSTAHVIGELLYTFYFYPFQLAGVLLLISMVSAVYVTIFQKRLQNGTKQQSPVKQLSADSRAQMVKIGFRKGVKF